MTESTRFEHCTDTGDSAISAKSAPRCLTASWFKETYGIPVQGVCLAAWKATRVQQHTARPPKQRTSLTGIRKHSNTQQGRQAAHVVDFDVVGIEHDGQQQARPHEREHEERQRVEHGRQDGVTALQVAEVDVAAREAHLHHACAGSASITLSASDGSFSCTYNALTQDSHRCCTA